MKFLKTSFIKAYRDGSIAVILFWIIGGFAAYNAGYGYVAQQFVYDDYVHEKAKEFGLYAFVILVGPITLSFVLYLNLIRDQKRKMNDLRVELDNLKRKLQLPFVFKDSIELTHNNLHLINTDRLLYCEISCMGAMGNEGGILLYLMDEENDLITLETNISLYKDLYESVRKLILEDKLKFRHYYGGMGNDVFIRKDLDFEIDEVNNCFWYARNNKRFCIKPSVNGVFQSLVEELRLANRSLSSD